MAIPPEILQSAMEAWRGGLPLQAGQTLAPDIERHAHPGDLGLGNGGGVDPLGQPPPTFGDRLGQSGLGLLQALGGVPQTWRPPKPSAPPKPDPEPPELARGGGIPQAPLQAPTDYWTPTPPAPLGPPNFLGPYSPRPPVFRPEMGLPLRLRGG